MKKKIFILVSIFSLCFSSLSWSEDVSAKTTSYTLDEIVEFTKRLNYQVRADAFRVYKARNEVDVAMGKIPPYFNLHMALEIINQDYYTVASHLVGFLWPSNWYNLFEATELSRSKLFAYKAVVSNQINGVKNLYYEIAMVAAKKKLLEAQQKLIDDIQSPIVSAQETGELDVLELFELELAPGDLKLQINETRNALRSMKLVLAQKIGLPSPVWDSFEISEPAWPEDLASPGRSQEELEEIAIRRSYDLASWEYQIRAAREGADRRKWAWGFIQMLKVKAHSVPGISHFEILET